MPMNDEKCTSCCWARLEGNVLFCPAAQGTCMQEEIKTMHREARRDQAQEIEAAETESCAEQTD